MYGAKETRRNRVHTVRFYLHEIPEKAEESMVTESRSVIVWGLGTQGGGSGLTEKGHKGTFGDDGNVLYLYCSWLRGYLHVSKLIELYILIMGAFYFT